MLYVWNMQINMKDEYMHIHTYTDPVYTSM